jgi:hypothetical protein
MYSISPGQMKNIFQVFSILSLFFIHFSYSSLFNGKNVLINLPNGVTIGLDKLIQLPAYEIHNLLGTTKPEERGVKKFGDLVAKPDKTPKDYFDLLVLLSDAFDSRIPNSLTSNDIAALVTYEDATLGPFFKKLCSRNVAFYETGSENNFNFNSDYVQYLLPTNLIKGFFKGKHDFFCINSFVLTFKLSLPPHSFQYAGKTHNLHFDMTKSNEKLLLKSYQKTLYQFSESVAVNGADTTIIDGFNSIRTVFDNFLEDYKVLKASPLSLDCLNVLMESIRNRLKAGTPVMIRSLILGDNILHINGILLHKDTIMFFCRLRGFGAAKFYCIKPELLTNEILLELHFNLSIEAVYEVVKSIVDDKLDLLVSPRVTGCQFSMSCSNEYIKDLLWGLFNIYHVCSFYPKFTKYIQRVEWDKMINLYHEYEFIEDSDSKSILKIFKKLLLTAYIQMDEKLNKELVLPFKFTDEELIYCWTAFFYELLKSSDFAYPERDCKIPKINLDTLKSEGTVGELVQKKIESWKTIELNAQKFLKKFASSKEYHPILQLLGDVIINQGENCVEIARKLSDTDCKVIRKLGTEKYGFSLLNALSLSMQKNPESFISTENFVFLMELQYGDDWDKLIYGNVNIYKKIYFNIKGEPTAKSILYQLLWLQNSIQYEGNYEYFFSTFLRLSHKITFKMVNEIPQLSHALMISKDFEICDSPNFIFRIILQIARKLGPKMLNVFLMSELNHPVKIDISLKNA